MDEFGDRIGSCGFYFAYPYYYELGDGKGRVRRRTKGKIQGKGKGKAEPQGMRAPRPGVPIYARNRRGMLCACYRGSNGRLVAFSSSGSEPLSTSQMLLQRKNLTALSMIHFLLCLKHSSSDGLS